ncbi:MAG: hypothetical protein HYY16_17480 [Planctomycetes bacterium]|nr:hypothetical protein [Planctomycetota bacterium]
MAANSAVMQAARDLFLQQVQTVEPPPLEMFVKVREPNDHHFYCKHVSFLDVALSFGADIRPLECLIYRMPPALLNPNYWEPLTRESEAAVREKTTGIITRQDREHTLIWRSDAVAKDRILRDGLDVPLELVHGYVFRTTGEGVLKLGRAWSGGQDRFDWIGFAALPSGEPLNSLVLASHADLTAFRFSSPDERILFASQDDRSVRMLFSQRAWLRRAVTAAIRGFAVNLSKQPCAAINDRVSEQLIRLCDGVGFTADPARDFAGKARTFEITARLGQTEWGLQLKPGHDPLLGDEKILIYYDRTSGIWAVAS